MVYEPELKTPAERDAQLATCEVRSGLVWSGLVWWLWPVGL